MVENSKYMEGMKERFKETFPHWANEAVRVEVRYSEGLRVTLKNGDVVYYNDRTSSARYVKAERYLDECGAGSGGSVGGTVGVGGSRSDAYTEERCREIFSANLAGLMEIRGYGQASLSKASGLSQALISKYLNKKSTPTFTTLMRLTAALRCDIEDLMME